MNTEEIKQKASELEVILIKYRSDLSVLERELLRAVNAYHAALREEKLKMLKQEMSKL
jgi:hypothetical protein